MDWQGITAIIGAVSGLLAVFGGGIYLGQLHTKVDTLWTMWLEATASRHHDRGLYLESSPRKLTPEALSLLPKPVKDDIVRMAARRRISREKDLRPRIIQGLGLARLTELARANGATLEEIITVVGVYIEELSCTKG